MCKPKRLVRYPAVWLLALTLPGTVAVGQVVPTASAPSLPGSGMSRQTARPAEGQRLSLSERLRLFHRKKKGHLLPGQTGEKGRYGANRSRNVAGTLQPTGRTAARPIASGRISPESSAPAAGAYSSYRRRWSPVGTSAPPAGRLPFSGRQNVVGVVSRPSEGAGVAPSRFSRNGLPAAEEGGGSRPMSPLGYSADDEGWSVRGERNRLTGGLVHSPVSSPGEQTGQEGEGPLRATLYSPQTPGEIPELVPEEKPPEHIFLPEAREPEAEKSWWRRFRETVHTTPPLVKQKLYGAGTWVWGGENDVGFYDVFVQGTFASPWWRGFSIAPVFQVYFLDGPTRTDLPPRLYSTRLEFRWQKQLNERWGMDLSVAPGVYSDFEQSDSDSFRIMGRALGVYQWSVYSQFVLGVVYLDREDVKVIPAVGWIYTPREDWRLEFVFPRPKLAVRFSQREQYSRWGYLLGEFGGGSWSVERRNGRQDIVSYSDLRLLFGFEQRYVNGRSLLLEIGVVFDREIEFKSNNGDFDPSTTGLLRTGVVY